MKAIKIIVILLFFLNIPKPYAQEYGKAFIHNYHPRDYSGHYQNWSIISDHRGVLYIGNHRELLEYDGVNFRHININNKPVRSLAIDNTGKIFIGAVDEIGYLKPENNGNLAYHSLNHLIDSTYKKFSYIWNINIIDDMIYYQGDKHLFRYKDNQIKTWELNNAYHKSFVKNNVLYLNQKNIGLCVLKNDSIQPIKNGHVLANMNISVMLSINEGILIGTQLNGLYLFSKKTSTIVPFEVESNEIFKKYRIYSGIRINKDLICIGTSRKGIFIINNEGKILENINYETGLINNAVHSTYIEDHKPLWVALDKGFANIKINEPFRFWNEKNGLEGVIYDIIRYKGHIYTGTNMGVYYLSQSKHPLDISKFYKVKNINNEIWSFCKFNLELKNHSKKESFLAASSDGVYEIINNKGELITNKNRVFKVLQSAKDPHRVFIGLNNGISSIYWDEINSKWTDEDYHEKANILVRDIDEDKKGYIWISTMFSGVLRLEPKDITLKKYEVSYFGESHGLPSDNTIRIFSIDNELLFATNKGVFSFDEAKEQFVKSNLLTNEFDNQTITSPQLAIDNNKNIWTNTGIVLLKQTDNTYKKNNKILSALNSMSANTIYTEENNLWFGGSEGLYKFNLKKLNPDSLPYHTLIRKVELGKDSVIFWGTHYNDLGNIIVSQPNNQIPGINYKHNSITFHYAATCFNKEQANRFSYYLDGYDKNWSEWSLITMKEYTNLPEGIYTFKVRAINSCNMESIITTYKFIITAPWYKTYWAFIGYFFILIGIIYFSIYLNSRRLKIQNQRLEEVIELRTTEIQEKNEELKQQKEEIATQRDALSDANATKDKFFNIISHDLKSPFNALIGFSEILSENAMILTKEKVQKYSDQLFDSAKRLYNLIENMLAWSRTKTGRMEYHPEIVDLFNLTSNSIALLKQNAEKKKINIISEIQKETLVFVDVNLIDSVIRNLVSNAIKFSNHNSTIHISSINSGNFIEISIKDYGVGISKDEFDKLFKENIHYTKLGTDKEKGTGLGLILCKEFVTQNGGEIDIKSEIGKGSTFSFTLPKPS